MNPRPEATDKLELKLRMVTEQRHAAQLASTVDSDGTGL
jgi:hypothetical protein